MITRIFTGRAELLQYLIIVAFSVLVFSIPVSIAEPSGFNPFFNSLYNLISDNDIIIRVLFILLIATPIILAQMALEYLNIIERNNKYLLLVAPMLIFSNASAWELTPALISLNFLVFGTVFIFKISEDDKSIKKLASSAVIFSIGSLFYSVNIFSIIALIIAINIFRQITLRAILAVVFSFLLPYIYLFVYYFVTDKFILKYQEILTQFSHFGFNYSFQGETLSWVFYIFIAMVSTFIVFSVLTNLRNSLIQVRKYISFIFWGLLNTSFLFLFINKNLSQHLIILIFLISLFYVFFLNKKKKNWIFDIVFVLILVYDMFVMYNLIIS